MIVGSIAEWIAGLPALRDNLVRDRRDALQYAAQAVVDKDELAHETWTAIAVRRDKDLLRVDAQLALVDRCGAHMLETQGDDGVAG